MRKRVAVAMSFSTLPPKRPRPSGGEAAASAVARVCEAARTDALEDLRRQIAELELDDGKLRALLQSALLSACSAGSASVVDHLLGLEPRIDAARHSNAAFRAAAAAGHVEIVARLLSVAGVDPDACGSDALVRASLAGHIDVVRILVADGRSDLGAGDSAALFCAASHGDMELLDRLLADPRVDAAGYDNAALREAAANGHTAAVARLLANPRVHPAERRLVDLYSGGLDHCVRIYETLITAEERYIYIPGIAPHSAGGAAAERLRAALADPRSDPRTYFDSALARAARSGHVEAMAVLLADPRVDPSTDAAVSQQRVDDAIDAGDATVDKVPAARKDIAGSVCEQVLRDQLVALWTRGGTVLALAAREGQVAAVERLLADPRVTAEASHVTEAVWSALEGNHQAVLAPLLRCARAMSSPDNFTVLQEIVTAIRCSAAAVASTGSNAATIAHARFKASKLASKAGITVEAAVSTIDGALAELAAGGSLASEECAAAAAAAAASAGSDALTDAVKRRAAACQWPAARAPFDWKSRAFPTGHLHSLLSVCYYDSEPAGAAAIGDMTTLNATLSSHASHFGSGVEQAARALLYASAAGNATAVELLLAWLQKHAGPEAAGAARNRSFSACCTALLVASANCHRDIAAALLRHREAGLAAGHSRDVLHGGLALRYACARGQLHVVDLLLSNPGIDPACAVPDRTSRGMLPLERSWVAAVDRMLVSAVEGWSDRIRGYTPLWDAVAHGHAAVVERLLADPRVDASLESLTVGLDWDKLLQAAAQSGNADVLELLLAAQRIPDADAARWRSQCSRLALPAAAARGDVWTVRQLLTRSAAAHDSVGAGSNAGAGAGAASTPAAAADGPSGAAMASAGAGIGAVKAGNVELRAAFMAAAAAGHAGVIAALLQADGPVAERMAAILATPSPKCAAAQGAFWSALRIDHDDAQPPGTALRTGDFALLAAAVEGHVAVCSLLLQQQAVDPGAASNAAIRLAVRHSHAGLVDLLLADPRVDPFQTPGPPARLPPAAPAPALGVGGAAGPQLAFGGAAGFGAGAAGAGAGAGAGAAAAANPFFRFGGDFAAPAAVPAAIGTGSCKCAVEEAHQLGSFILRRLALHPRILHRLLRRDFASPPPPLSSLDIDVPAIAALAWRRRRGAVLGRITTLARK